jgi:hypothetical protein
MRKIAALALVLGIFIPLCSVQPTAADETPGGTDLPGKAEALATETAPAAKTPPLIRAQLAVPNPPAFGPLPGEFAISTRKGYFTARDGGHHTIDAITTAATTIGPFEKFKLAQVQPDFTTIQTAGGYFLTAIGGQGGGSDPTRVVQTEVLSPTQTDAELFRFKRNPLEYPGSALYTIQTVGGFFLTALGGGGKSTGAFHSDARKAAAWELYELAKCGDPGSGYEFTIRPKRYDGIAMMAHGGGGHVKPGLILANLISGGFDVNWTRLKLIRQSDGSHALQTFNGVNFVTAIRGGGIAHSSADFDNLVTDRTEVQAWERFTIRDRGDCTYTIQTVDGWFLAYGPGWDISTRISDPNAAPQIGYNPLFELRMWFRP